MNMDADVKFDDSFEQFEAKYKPIVNTIKRPNGQSYFYETYGEELEHLMKQSPYNVWTLVSAGGDWVIMSGWHFVYRMGYFITEVAWDEITDNERMSRCLQ
jgi:hypothetical protein